MACWDALRNVLICKIAQGAESAVPVDSSHMELLKETAEGISEEQLIHWCVRTDTNRTSDSFQCQSADFAGAGICKNGTAAICGDTRGAGQQSGAAGTKAGTRRACSSAGSGSA